MLKGKWVNQGLDNSPFRVQPMDLPVPFWRHTDVIQGRPRAGWPLGPEEIRSGLLERGIDRQSIKKH